VTSTGTRARPASIAVARELAEQYGLPYADLRAVGVHRSAVETIDAAVLVRLRALPYGFEGERLLVAVSNPADVQALDELRFAAKVALQFAVAPREDIELELRNLDRQVEAIRRAAKEE
jgi:hypothetical protein